MVGLKGTETGQSKEGSQISEILQDRIIVANVSSFKKKKNDSEDDADISRTATPTTDPEGTGQGAQDQGG